MSLDAVLQINMLRAEFQTPLVSEAVNSLGQAEGHGFSDRLAGFAANPADPNGGSAIHPVEPSAFFNNVSDMVGEWSRGANEIKKMFNEALGGKPLSQTQLLYLQASTHAVAFEFEAMGKVIETSSNAIKTTVQTQV